MQSCSRHRCCALHAPLGTKQSCCRQMWTPFGAPHTDMPMPTRRRWNPARAAPRPNGAASRERC